MINVHEDFGGFVTDECWTLLNSSQTELVEEFEAGQDGGRKFSLARVSESFGGLRLISADHSTASVSERGVGLVAMRRSVQPVNE